MITGAACTDVYLIAKLSAFGSCCQLAVFYGVASCFKEAKCLSYRTSFCDSVQPSLLPTRLHLSLFYIVKQTPMQHKGQNPYSGHAPERRCSSRTFRYGYLVTT